MKGRWIDSTKFSGSVTIESEGKEDSLIGEFENNTLRNGIHIHNKSTIYDGKFNEHGMLTSGKRTQKIGHEDLVEEGEFKDDLLIKGTASTMHSSFLYI